MFLYITFDSLTPFIKRPLLFMHWRILKVDNWKPRTVEIIYFHKMLNYATASAAIIPVKIRNDKNQMKLCATRCKTQFRFNYYKTYIIIIYLEFFLCNKIFQKIFSSNFNAYNTNILLSIFLMLRVLIIQNIETFYCKHWKYSRKNIFLVRAISEMSQMSYRNNSK